MVQKSPIEEFCFEGGMEGVWLMCIGVYGLGRYSLVYGLVVAMR